MTITKAIERISWRFKNHIKSNKTDQEALNAVVSFVNTKHKKQLQDNEMFAKVYIFMYAYFIKHYNTDIFDSIPQKELHRYLNQPLESIIERFKDRLNEQEMESMFREKGIKIKHPATETKKKREDTLKKFTRKDFDDVWDYETVSEHLETMINLTLN